MPASKFKLEREIWQKGLTRIAGADEAGRGPLAGPVVAAVVCLPVSWIERGLPRGLRGLNDSKQLEAAERNDYYQGLLADPEICWAVARVDAAVIDAINILQASLRAMLAAFLQLEPRPEHTLVDGPHRFSPHHPQTPVIKGDARSYSIAAASVLAKVTRDRLMEEYHLAYPDYGFDEHKGYGTPQHLAALERFGPCPIHRRSFAPLRAKQLELFGARAPA